MQYKLYSYFRSSASYRVRIALNLKGIRYDIEPRHLRRGEHRTSAFLRLNPQGLVPVLEHDGQYFSQSLAIIEYVEERHPLPSLLPPEPQARAIVRSMALTIACDMHPLCNLRVLQYLRQELDRDEDAVNGWYRHWIAEGFDALEPMIAECRGQYCFGDEITIADVCLLPQVHNARRFGCDLGAYPCITDIAGALSAHPAFVAAEPSRQPDAE